MWPFKEKAPKVRGRIGLINLDVKAGPNWNGTAQYKAEETWSDEIFSKVKILDVTGVPDRLRFSAKNLLTEFYPTSKIMWLNEKEDHENY